MTHCRYHPVDPAVRICESCAVQFCEACCDESPLRHTRRAVHACFLCGAPLEDLHGASTVPPFWRILGQVYRYPLAKSAFAAILITALLSALLSGFGLLLFIPSVAILLYCFACLRETASGKLAAPGVGEMLEGSIKPIFGIILVTVVAILTTYKALDMFGTGVSILVGLFYAVSLPAAILVIAIEGKLAPALNPAKLVSVIAATGASYFVMLLFLIIMISSMALLESLFYQSEPTFLGVFISSSIANYYTVVEFHILGYLVYQHQYELGYKLHKGSDAAAVRSQEQWLNAKLEVLIKAGDYPAAIQVAKQQVSDEKANLWQWGRCFKLMCTGSNFDELKAFAPRYFAKLASSQQHAALADAYVMVKKRVRRFQINDDDQCLAVAQQLFELGRYRYVIEMLKNFHTRSAQPTQINESLMLMSQSYLKIPGMEKSAAIYQNLHELRNSNA